MTTTKQDLIIAEIQSMHREKHGESPRYAPDDFDHEQEPTHFEPYVICDYDKTQWPCRTQLILNADAQPVRIRPPQC